MSSHAPSIVSGRTFMDEPFASDVNSKSLASLQEFEQVVTVSGLAQFLRARTEGVVVEESTTPRDLFRHSDFEALTLFDRANEVAGIEETVEGSGVEPRGAARQDGHRQFAAFEIVGVDVGDLVFAAGAGLQPAGDLDDVVVVEVQAGGTAKFDFGCAGFSSSEIAVPSASKSTTPYASGLDTQ